MRHRLCAGDEGAAASVIGAPELASRRPDGLRGIVAPQLRGEGNWPLPRAAALAGLDARIFHAVDALMADVPFWFRVRLLPRPLRPCLRSL